MAEKSQIQTFMGRGGKHEQRAGFRDTDQRIK
jgi:hypothetical protein